MAKSGEKILAGPPSGFLELGDQVTFEAKHFGIRQRLTAKIVEYEWPNLFTDQMVSGAFKSLRHEHRFRIDGESTMMTDVLEFEAPFGFVGRGAEAILGPYMRRLLVGRGVELKRLAESRAPEDGG